MVRGSGPFQIIENDGDGQVAYPIDCPRRRHECEHYTSCLNIAAALNWDNFTCRGCCGEIDQSLLWRALQECKRDRVAERICEIPKVEVIMAESELEATSRATGSK